MSRALPLLLILAATGCVTPQASKPAPQTTRLVAIVEPLETTYLALFWAEKEMLRRAVADHLKRQSSLHIQPLSDLELNVLRAQVKKNSQQCGLPNRAQLLANKYPDAVYVQTSAECVSRPCTLDVQIGRKSADGEWQSLQKWSTVIKDPTSARHWVNAVGDLKVYTQERFGLGGLGATFGSEPPVHVLSTSSVHPWKTVPTVPMLRKAQPALNACHAPGRKTSGIDKLAIEVSPRGRIQRCEGEPYDSNEGPRRMKCLCRALAGLQYEAGPKGRRFEVHLLNTAAETGGKSDCSITPQ